MALTALRRRRAKAYGVGVAAGRPYWAFYSDGSTLHAWEYSDGEPIGDRATLSGSGVELQGGGPVLIPSDPMGIVGPGSLAWHTGGSARLLVWDVPGAALYEYTSDQLLSKVLFHEGYLYWVQNPHSTPFGNATFELWRSPTDLSLPELQSSLSFSQFSVDWDSGSAAAFLAGSSLFVRRGWLENINVEAVGYDILRFPLSGNLPSRLEGDQGDPEGEQPQLGIPGPSGFSYGTDSGLLLRHPEDLAGFWSRAWPDSDSWRLDIPYNAALSPDGSEAMLYGLLDDEAIVLRDRNSASGAEPETSFTVAPHPAVGQPPNVLFPRD